MHKGVYPRPPPSPTTDVACCGHWSGRTPHQAGPAVHLLRRSAGSLACERQRVAPQAFEGERREGEHCKGWGADHFSGSGLELTEDLEPTHLFPE